MENNNHKIDKNKIVAQRIFWSLFAFFFVYAIVRHNLFGGVDWFFASSFTLNKALAWTALSAIALSYSIGYFAKRGANWAKSISDTPKYFGQWGFIMAMIHAVLSLRILTPELFPDIYTPELEFNTQGNLIILFGVLALSTIIMPGISSLPSVRKNMNEAKFRRFQQLGYITLFFVSLHVAVLGSYKWTNMNYWYGFMPPISLLTFVIAMIPLFLKLLSVMKKKDKV
jgi:hypothetical protein